jgi:hypothetical protein
MKATKRLASGLAVCALAAAAGLAQAADPAQDRKPAAKPLSGAALLQLDDGRSGRGNLIATTGIRGFSKPPTPAAHALIMTIGDYQGNIPKLKGVAHDSATASDIARRMGVPAANIRTLKDGELTLEGMRRAFDELEAKLGGDEQIFIYYSGHGGRQLVQEDAGERCAESLITVDGKGFTDAEMETRLKRMSGKTQKTIVFLDACHSGGVTTRSVGTASALFTPKSYTPAGQNCLKPSNVLTRGINTPKPPGSGGANFVHIAAARDSEVSLDQPGRGGVATQAWLACMSGAAVDGDGSGGLSAAEIQSCAQQRINEKLKNVQGFLPHHVSVTGNPATVLSYAVAPPAASAEPPAAPVPLVVPVPIPVPVALPGALPTPAIDAAPPAPVATPAAPAAAVVAPVVGAAPAPLSALAALQDIYHSRDDRRLVTLSAARPTLRIGVDTIDFTLSSREGGYVYLLMVGSDGQTFDLLFPNQIDRNNLIEPGGTMRLPRPSWQLSAEGPPGKNTLLAIVTDNPRDFSEAGLKPSGPFSQVNAVAAKDIQLVTVSTARSGDAECSGAASTRTLAVQKRCSTGYAAALLTIEEVR